MNRQSIKEAIEMANKYIEKDKYYKITSKIKTLVGEGSGAVVRLVNSSSEELVALNNLNTSGTWQTVEFYVKANAYTSNTLNIEYWNGFGGQGDGKWTAGENRRRLSPGRPAESSACQHLPERVRPGDDQAGRAGHSVCG